MFLKKRRAIRKRHSTRDGLLSFAPALDPRMLRSLETLLPTVSTYTSPKGVKGEVLSITSVQPRLSKRKRPASHVRTKTIVRAGDHIAASSSDYTHKHTHVLLLPGNPGVIDFYRSLMSNIWQRLPEHVVQNMTMTGLGLPGHDFDKLNGVQKYGIADHVQYVIAYLADLQPFIAESNVVLMGHSYGSYLSLRVLKEFPNLSRRAHFVMLMPAIYRLRKCAGSLMTILMTTAARSLTSKAAGLVTALIARSPFQLRSSVLGMSGHDENACQVLHSWIENGRHELYGNITELLRNEVRDIREPGDHQIARSIAPRSYLYCTENDRWCPPEALDAIKKAFGENLTIKMEATTNVEHAFVLKMEQTEAVGQVVASWISQMLKPANIS